MSPNVVNRPLWMSNPNLALVAQLKGFMMVFGNTIAPKLYKDVIKPLSPVHRNRQGGIEARMPNFEGTFRYGLTFGLLLSAMYGTQIMKDAIKYEDADDSPLDDLEDWELMFKLLQQSNLLGYGNVLISAVESEKYGQSFIATALGPVATKAERLVKGLNALRDDRPRTLANWLARNTPFTGALSTDRRAEVPFVGTDAFEEYLESLLGMKEGGFISDYIGDGDDTQAAAVPTPVDIDKYGWKDNKTIQKIIEDDPIIGKIIQAESSGNQNTPDSPKGAMGLMQLMPKTAFGRVTEDGEQLYAHGMYGKRLTPEEVYDPEKNVVFGAQYFNALRKTFGNDRDALIAYNFGVGNTKKWLKRGGNLEELPKETRNYIKKILGSK